MRGNRVVSATCYLPLSDSLSLSKDLGTRHRAAVGVSEVSDSLTIIVSEETGSVSTAYKGQIEHDIDADHLRTQLKLLQNRHREPGKFELIKRRFKNGKEASKTFTNNIGFKILAIAFAFILWLVVYNLNDPVKTKTFTTTVTVTGRDSVVDKGLWPTIKDSEKTISFSVSGKRSYLNELDDSDFYANVDLANIIVDKDDTNKASVKVDIGCTKYRHSITFNGGDHMLPLSVEKYMQKQFEVKVSLDGSLSGAKALGNKPQANPKVVKIGGPESIVSTIASANVNIKVDDNTIISDNQITDRGDLTLIDDNGDEIDISKLDVDSQYQSIAVTVDVLSTKEVPIKCTTTGSPAGGKSVLGVELSEESVMLKGNAEALNNITSIDVGPIDISGATDDISTSVDLTGYLPDGVFIVNSSKAKLSIDIKIETNATSTMTLNSSNITYDGLEEGYTLTFVTDKSSVIVSGTKSDIDTLSGTTLKGKIDVTGLDAGTHTVTVKPNLDETKYTWGEIKVQIVIGRKGDGGGTTGTDGTGTASGSTTGGTTSGDTGSGSTGTGGTSSGSTSSGNTGNNGSDSSSH